MTVPFKAFRQFNDPRLQALAGLRSPITAGIAAHFSEHRHMDRLALALAARRALPLKELLESAEFYMRVRRRIRAQTVVDLCAGHGLVGLLFAAFERSVSTQSCCQCLNAPPSCGVRSLAADRARVAFLYVISSQSSCHCVHPRTSPAFMMRRPICAITRSSRRYASGCRARRRAMQAPRDARSRLRVRWGLNPN